MFMHIFLVCVKVIIYFGFVLHPGNVINLNLSNLLMGGTVVQLVERWSRDQYIAGSNLTRGNAA